MREVKESVFFFIFINKILVQIQLIGFLMIKFEAANISPDLRAPAQDSNHNLFGI